MFMIERGCLIFITDICWKRNYGCCIGIAIESDNYQTLFNDLSAGGLTSIPIPLIVELVEFFHAEADMKVQPFTMSWYLRSRF